MIDMVETEQSLKSTIAPMDWDIDEVVQRLRVIRSQSLAARNRLRNPTVLPSRNALSKIVDNLGCALFPNRLGNRALTPESIDYFVGQVIDSTLNELVEQVAIEIQFRSLEKISPSELRSRATEIVKGFSHELPEIRLLIDSDIRAAYEADPAAKSTDEILACYPGIFAIIHFRIAHALYTRGVPLIARMISEVAHSKTGIDIHPGAKIEGEFFIDHGTGVVIGETAIVGKRVRIYHGVTLGGHTIGQANEVKLEIDDRRHPHIEDDVIIYAGATLLGRIRIGKNAIVGGNVWITEDIPAGTIVFQAKAQTDSFIEGSGI